MKTKLGKTQRNKKVETKKKKTEKNCWTPERIQDALLDSQNNQESTWNKKGLPSLIDEIIRNYSKFGSMDHLEGKDLPSKKVVIEILEDLFTIFFPGYLGKTGITRSNIKYFLGNTLASVYTRLTQEIEKSLKCVCRKIKECPTDICQKRAEVVVKELLEKRSLNVSINH